METSSRFPPLWLTMLASTPVTCWLERPRRSAAGPTFFSMSLGMVTEVPVDLGVVVQALLGTNSSTSVEVGEQWGDAGVEEVPVEEEGPAVCARVYERAFFFLASWTQTLTNLFNGITNNYKLIQFQYKLLMRISTCKYMRFKMRIAKDNDQCSLCQGGLETLEHIFIQCPHTNIFKNILNTFIKNKIDREYRDNRNYHFMICNHANPLVNYINLTAKWYISRNFQQSKPLIYDEFVRYTKFALNGDKSNICIVLKQALKS